jgi:hypothetical protein
VVPERHTPLEPRATEKTWPSTPLSWLSSLLGGSSGKQKRRRLLHEASLSKVPPVAAPSAALVASLGAMTLRGDEARALVHAWRDSRDRDANQGGRDDTAVAAFRGASGSGSGVRGGKGKARGSKGPAVALDCEAVVYDHAANNGNGTAAAASVRGAAWQALLSHGGIGAGGPRRHRNHNHTTTATAATTAAAASGDPLPAAAALLAALSADGEGSENAHASALRTLATLCLSEGPAPLVARGLPFLAPPDSTAAAAHNDTSNRSNSSASAGAVSSSTGSGVNVTIGSSLSPSLSLPSLTAVDVLRALGVYGRAPAHPAAPDHSGSSTGSSPATHAGNGLHSSGEGAAEVNSTEPLSVLGSGSGSGSGKKGDNGGLRVLIVSADDRNMKV